MYLEISNRKTGKTKRFINALIGEMVKNPDYIFLVFCLDKLSLPKCIRRNRRIKINPSSIRGYNENKLKLFVDDLDCCYRFESIYNDDNPLIYHSKIMKNSYITVSKGRKKAIIEDVLKFNNGNYYEHKWYKL